MGIRVLAALIVALMAGAASASVLDELPMDIQAFIERADGCLHWAGEEPYDAIRRQEIDKALQELRCLELKADLFALKAAYPDRADLMQVLAETFEL